MALEIGAVVWGVKDVERSVEFWSAALDYVVKYHAPDDFAIFCRGKGTAYSCP